MSASVPAVLVCQAVINRIMVENLECMCTTESLNIRFNFY